MPFGIEIKLNNSREINVNRYYPKLMSYASLRKALKKNVTTGEPALIKEFECNCEKHKGLYLQALVSENRDTLTVRKCEYTAKATGQVAINLEGKFLLEGYEFYSQHPDWKVRVAVIIGLSKSTEGRAVTILSDMLIDHHWGVKLAAIQALEATELKPAKRVLEGLVKENRKGKIGRLAHRAMKRINFGVDIDKLDKVALHKLHQSTLSKKIYHPKSKTNKLLVSKKIFRGALSRNSLQKYFNHYDMLHTNHKPQFNSVKFHKKNILVKMNRPTKKKTGHDKLNYVNNLLFKNMLPINRLDNITNPICGEIYWAVVNKGDPKVTRPLLIVEAVNRGAGDFLTLPLTSDVLSQSDSSMIAEVEGKMSRIQITRERIIHKSLLLNKCGNISDSNLETIRKVRRNIEQKNIISQKFRFHKHVKYKKPSVKVDDKKYIVDDIPVSFETKSKISMISEMPFPIIDSENEKNRGKRSSEFFKLVNKEKCYWYSDAKNKKLSISIDNPQNLLKYLSSIPNKHPKIGINIFQSLEEAEKNLKHKFTEKTINNGGIYKGFIFELNISQQICIKLFDSKKYEELRGKIDSIREYSREPVNGMKLDNEELAEKDTSYTIVNGVSSMERS